MSIDDPVAWLSAGKPLAAVVLCQLWAAGHVDVDRPVADWVPDFAARGKEGVTLRHVLTHTGGFRSLFDLQGDAASWEEAVERVCRSRLEKGWIPGERAAYQPRSGWQILGEVIRRVTGDPVEQVVAERVLAPCDMAATTLWRRGEDAPLAPLFDTAGEAPVALSGSTAYCSPGAGASGPVDDLRRFYEVMLRGGDGPRGRLLPADLIWQMTAPQRQGLTDETFRHVVDWGLGFVLDSNRYGAGTVPYGYGRHCSRQSFGHGGSQCCTGFADPEHGLAVALAVDGRPGEKRHNDRFRDTLTALYEDLGLAPSLAMEAV